MNTIIITAGGVGKRMGATVPKQFLLLNNLPILMHSIQRFYDYDNALQILVTLPESEVDAWKKLRTQYKFIINHEIVVGGVERYDSIKNALQFCKGEIIGVHDGVRPLVSYDCIKSCFESAEKFGSAIPVLAILESLRFTDHQKNNSVDRSKYKIVQTPQCFKKEIIINAYENEISADTTDDASLVEKTGVELNLIPGNSENIKITLQKDLLIAEVLLASVLDSYPK